MIIQRDGIASCAPSRGMQNEPDGVQSCGRSHRVPPVSLEARATPDVGLRDQARRVQIHLSASACVCSRAIALIGAAKFQRIAGALATLRVRSAVLDGSMGNRPALLQFRVGVGFAHGSVARTIARKTLSSRPDRSHRRGSNKASTASISASSSSAISSRSLSRMGAMRS